MTTPVSEQKVSPEMERLIFDHLNASLSYHSSMDTEWSMTKGVFLMQEAEEKLLTAISSLESQLAEAGRDTERWKWAKSGLFITPHPDHEIRVVYQSGMMDEVAQELYASLPKDERGIVWDVTPVFDKRAADSARGAPHD